nr:MAG TPA_asm: hypothetical protein [Bacteriophage sp.]
MGGLGYEPGATDIASSGQPFGAAILLVSRTGFAWLWSSR